MLILNEHNSSLLLFSNVVYLIIGHL